MKYTILEQGETSLTIRIFTETDVLDRVIPLPVVKSEQQQIDEFIESELSVFDEVQAKKDETWVSVSGDAKAPSGIKELVTDKESLDVQTIIR